MLVILDLNGTLVETSFHRLPNAHYNCIVRKKFVYNRPFLEHFLDFIFSHPDVTAVAIWTSCQEVNAIPLVNMVFEGRPKPLFVWHREQCDKVERFGDKYATIKDLRKVWETYPDFGPSNTLIIDDSPSKLLPIHTKNHIPIRTYESSSLNVADDNELLSVKTCLLSRL